MYAFETAECGGTRIEEFGMRSRSCALAAVPAVEAAFSRLRRRWSENADGTRIREHARATRLAPAPRARDQRRAT